MNRNGNHNRVPQWVQRKYVVIFLVVTGIFICLIGRVIYINASDGYQYQRKVLEQQNYDSRVIPFKRGNITDRNGTILATSERVYNVILDARVLLTDSNLECVEPTKNALQNFFQIPVETTEEALTNSPESHYIVLKKQVDYETANAFLDYAEDDETGKTIAGVWLEDDYLRTYPYGSLASKVVGYSNSGSEGNQGLELYYNDQLSGTNGREYGYLDNNSGLERTIKDAVNGNNIVSTIDANLQSIVERYMKAWVETYRLSVEERDGCDNIGIILMDPNTGEVLSMASYPDYDLNNPRNLASYYTEEQLAVMTDEEKSNALQKIWRNFCVSDTYEPGSTEKSFTVAAGYEIGLLNGSETFTCTGSREVSGHVIHCHNRNGHGDITLQEAITESCNVALMDIALNMGEMNFYKYQRVFGFGQKTYIDLPGEADTSTLVYDGVDTAQSDLATNSFGQNFNCTMIQMAAAYCSLINGGHYYQPYCVKEIRNDQDDVVKSITPTLLKETVTEDTSSILRQYLLATVESGTGTGAQVPGYSIAGKTGTAEKLPRDEINYVISFAGFAPAENPEIFMYIVIDRPNVQSQEDTSLVTTLAAQLFSEILPYLNVSMVDGTVESSQDRRRVE